MDTVTTGMQTHGRGECRGKNIVSVDMQTKKKYFRSVDESEHLFPRLPNEITFCRIVPKLPWRAFHTLVAVSRAWRQAIQTHRVHDARIRLCSTDTLVLHCHKYLKSDVLQDDVAKIVLYSLRDKLCYDLPPIPGHYRGVPKSCQCISLDGKIYVIGGALEECSREGAPNFSSTKSSSKVYVMDLAGASHWKECTSMELGRKEFGCGVIDGKIYAFGGTHDFGPVRGAEVYNPKVNAWSPIRPMASLRFGHKVFTLAEEIVVHGGDCFDPSYTGWKANLGRRASENQYAAYSFEVEAPFTEVYHPGDLDDVDIGVGICVFVAQEKFHLMTEDSMYVQDDDADTGIKLWKYIRKSSLPLLELIGPDEELMTVCIASVATVALNGELLVGVQWHMEWDPLTLTLGSALLQSEGFRNEKDIILWKILSKCPDAFSDVLSCIQL